MPNPLARLFRRVLCATLLGATAALAQLPVVLGEPALAAKAAAAPQLHLPRNAAPSPSVRRVALAPISAAEVAPVRKANARSDAKRLVIGVVRSPSAGAMPTSEGLVWTAVDGGFAAQVAVASPGAAALRVSYALADMPLDAQMVFFGSGDASRLVGPIRMASITDRGVPWWSPVTEGDTQTVEFFVPGSTGPGNAQFRAVAASHLFAAPSSGFSKQTEDIGTSGSCNVDVACPPLNTSTAFQNASAGVAQMVFVDGPSTILCTGTLLNDTDTSSQIPWFLSANHCFENSAPPYKTAAEMQAVANTLDTLWFFEAAACHSSTVSPSYRQLTGGAAFLYNNATADGLFLRLNDAPPAGAYFDGWDPNTISAGAAAISIHHPQGDLKKVSQGTVQGFSTPGVAGGTDQYIQMQWSSGTTEQGSSGGGLFTGNGAQYLLRGALWGGLASCSAPASPDYFSQFSEIYPAIAAYLSPAAMGNVDYSDLWWNTSESGWGLNLVQHPSRNIFGVWYTYDFDGTQTWFVLPGGTWSSSNSFTGTLYSTSGPAANGTFDPSRVKVTPVGSGTLTFSDPNHGVWSFVVNGISGAKAIERQPF
jgi:lysyl endopeptidase